MVIPPDSKPRSNRSLKRARLKKKKAAAAATAKNGARQQPLPAPKQRKPPEIEKPDEHFAAANELLKKLIQSPEISEQFDPQMRTNTRMVYTKGVTLWMLILHGCDLFSPKVYGQLLSFSFWNCLGVEGSVLLRDSNIVSRVSDQMPLNAITRIARIAAPVLTPHFMPAHLNRWLNTILQAASVTPLPIGTRSRRRSA